MPSNGVKTPKTVYVANFKIGEHEFKKYFMLAEGMIRRRINMQFGIKIEESPLYPEILYLSELEVGYKPKNENGFSDVFVKNINHYGLTLTMRCFGWFCHDNWEIDIMINPDLIFRIEDLQQQLTELTEPEEIASNIIETFYAEKYLIRILMHEWLHLLGINGKRRDLTHYPSRTHYVMSSAGSWQTERQYRGSIMGLTNRFHPQTVEWLRCRFSL